MLTLSALDRLLLLLIGLAPVGYLSVGHWVNACTYSLFLIAAVWIARVKPRFDSFDWLVFLTFASPILAVAIGQLLRQKLYLSDFDAPTRLLASFFIFTLLRHRSDENPFFRRKIGLSILLGVIGGLIMVSLTIDPTKTAFFGGRYSTALTETNTLGAYLGILTLPVLASLIIMPSMEKPALVKSFGIFSLFLLLALGFYLVIKTQSRGALIGLLTGSSVLLISCLSIREFRKATALVLGFLAALFGGLWLLGTFQSISARWLSAISEPIEWFKHGSQNSSGGIRLSMMLATWDLFTEQWLCGYGDMGYAEHMRSVLQGQYADSTIHDMSLAGPHQEILARSLQSGIWGFISSLTLFLGPISASVYAFLKTRQRPNSDHDKILVVGCLAYAIQLLALQFTTEPYSLKATASYNGMMIAVLFAIVGSVLRPRASHV